MALDNRRKNRLRHVIRVTMVVVAAFLLFFALIIPVINNAIAFGIEGDLKSAPLPEHTEIVETTSVAGKLTGNGNGMQYFGAVLLESELSLEQLQKHYAAYRQGASDCFVEPQITNEIRPAGNLINPVSDLSFREPIDGEGYYILYSWGDAPAWVRDLLNTDMRGH